METKLAMLKADKEMTEVLRREKHNEILKDLREFINTEIVEPTGAQLTRLFFRSNFNNNLEVVFETGFLTPEGKIDFGSDCWFEYNEKGLNINVGTIGTWTRNDNPYQICRIKLLNYICDILEPLENSFQLILDKHKDYMDLESKTWKIDLEIRQIETEMKRQEAVRKMETIQVGTILCYPESYHPDYRLFSLNRWNKKEDLWKVTKISDKTIQVESTEYSSVTRRVNKEKLQQHILNAGLEIINENKETE